MPLRQRPTWHRPLAWAAVGVALAAVFAAYLDPDLMLRLANELWACF